MTAVQPHPIPRGTNGRIHALPVGAPVRPGEAQLQNLPHNFLRAIADEVEKVGDLKWVTYIK